MSSLLLKENAYVFDFDPARTLIIFDEFANNLSPNTASGRGTSEQREENIKRLLNFFPVLGEDDEGGMVQLDEKAVLSIPRRIKCTEVVRHGFMSNFLFQNIGNIFGAPSIVKDILEKFTPAQEDPKRNKRDGIERIDDTLKTETSHFAMYDTAEATKNTIFSGATTKNWKVYVYFLCLQKRLFYAGVRTPAFSI